MKEGNYEENLFNHSVNIIINMYNVRAGHY